MMRIKCGRRISRCGLGIGCLILVLLLCLSVLALVQKWHCPSGGTVHVASVTASPTDPDFHPELNVEPIDVVYTWVNGSDPHFLADLRRYALEHQHERQQATAGHSTAATIDATRFDDKNELRFSMRSLVAYAPWVRRVHVVTNGQLPHWLDLDCDRVRIHTHAELVSRDPVVEEQMLLPTFSSAAIETLLHLVPGLSERFLYLNDDVFLGRRAYLDDLWSRGGGVQVYRAWTVPDCADECPWSYVADGSCDSACNCAECQWDGGDCGGTTAAGTDPEIQRRQPTAVEHEQPVERDEDQLPRALFIEVPKLNNLSQQALHDHVDAFNAAQRNRLRRSRTAGAVHHSPDARPPRPRPRSHRAPPLPPQLDLYAASLIHTQRRLNVRHGFRARRVIGHVGFLLDTRIMADMQTVFAAEVATTRANRFRSADDLQFAFAYYHHLMERQQDHSVADIFDEFDTDRSGSWSDREIRTLLTRVYPLPLDWAAVRYFEQIVGNCSRERDEELWRQTGRAVPERRMEHGGYDEEAAAGREESGPTILYERYQDSSIPHISKELVVGCAGLAEVLRLNFGTRTRYRFSSAAKASALHSHFKMLTSNVTQVIEALDQLRQTPKLFNCINDNRLLMPIVHTSADGRLRSAGAEDTPSFSPDDDGSSLANDNALVAVLLDDFYVSLFPLRSEFELADGLRNRFVTVAEWRRWRSGRNRLRHSVWMLLGVVVLSLALARTVYCWRGRRRRRRGHHLRRGSSGTVPSGRMRSHSRRYRSSDEEDDEDEIDEEDGGCADDGASVIP